MLTSVLCVCVVTNILHEGLHIVSFYLGCCTSNYNLPTALINEGGKGCRRELKGNVRCGMRKRIRYLQSSFVKT